MNKDITFPNPISGEYKVFKVGDMVESECEACDATQIWEVEGIEENVEYGDGLFKTYYLKSIENCLGLAIRTSIKDCPESYKCYRLKTKDTNSGEDRYLEGDKDK